MIEKTHLKSPLCIKNMRTHKYKKLTVFLLISLVALLPSGCIEPERYQAVESQTYTSTSDALTTPTIVAPIQTSIQTPPSIPTPVITQPADAVYITPNPPDSTAIDSLVSTTPAATPETQTPTPTPTLIPTSTPATIQSTALTANGKNYIANTFGTGNCFIVAGLSWSYLGTDGVTYQETGATAQAVSRLILTPLVKNLTLKGVTYTYADLKAANDNIDLTLEDAEWIVQNDGDPPGEPQYCAPTPT